MGFDPMKFLGTFQLIVKVHHVEQLSLVKDATRRSQGKKQVVFPLLEVKATNHNKTHFAISFVVVL